MKKFLSIGIIAVLLLIGGASATQAKNIFSKLFHRSHHTKQAAAPVTQDQAQAAALKKVSGTVDDSKTETVKGKQMYWFAITDGTGQKNQVWVDMTGKVTKVTKEKMAKPVSAKTTK